MVGCWSAGILEWWNAGLMERGKWRLEMGKSGIGYSMVDVGYLVFWIFKILISILQSSRL